MCDPCGLQISCLIENIAVITSRELASIPFFTPLDEQTLADTARQMQRCTYRAGDHIVLEGEQTPGLFFVQRGRVRLSCTAPDGREQVLALVKSGEMFNVVPLFDDHPNPTNARAMSVVYTLLLPQKGLFQLISQHPDLARALLREMAEQLRELMVLVEDLAFRSVRERLARQLLYEAEEGPAELTHQELAERTGTVREIAGRALRQFAQEGLVQLQRGRVIVLDREGLLTIVGS
ncbi:MAG: cAMP-binding domain of CRP or a regulatory subunit of cAMP-dependent protein kinase [Chloroflexi bacterium AL-W]|nr:cAMP-binding domain of CRP or a regulatory subunit of cAMP-dependent protein kinases [Chloroflexi bacterium AL-N1]NOK68057.1 cAMP-binding domain of CRP or a regulatory subunit of cAMP-dependent protein kinase [Chloroflexi bacterium AL-N10]NOK73397.1 cAMP-binding domain of CRP or a regulatory subunit of cAMP-dependent protein kinase [Chloroflexi bacterium AL-N5]NOK83311.1 cAMP-binding domain of CRP or a regulatory subunit of cAMP-dependent protein kinase [Chloroflexi bacterium AL-W]NOK87728.1